MVHTSTRGEREISDVVGEEVVMEDMDYAELKNKVSDQRRDLQKEQNLNSHQMGN